ncbi:MAG TPA: DUF4412 domain-containing protein [Gemmatimonadales bacterium]|jgi:hypothetical protein|nr:DUF4412 domain-containing protein [Gemmatimonadales bacterium]
MLARVCALGLTVVSTAAAQGFEGTFTTRKVALRAEAVEEHAGDQREKVFELSVDRLIQLGASVDTTVMWIKGPRFRGQTMEMPGAGQAYILLNTATRVMTTVMPTQRSYYEISLAGLAEGAADTADEPEPTVEPLGRTQVIGGLRCTGYRVTDEGSVSLVWTTNDRNFRQVFEDHLRAWQMGDRGEAKTLGMFRKYGFPVMTQALDESEGYSVEIITLTPRTLADSLFVVPAGFRKTTAGR